MSTLNNLIKQLCSNGVEYKRLDDVLKYIQPTKYIVESTKYSDDYKTPVLTAGQTFILGYTNEEKGIYNASKENPVIIFDDFTTAFRWIDFEFKVKSSAMKLLIPKNDNVNFKYVYYAMKCIKYEVGDHSRQWISNYSQFRIPVPPFEVQCEIVRILDRYTMLMSDLESKLTSELIARKKQYGYYKEKLLNDNSNDKVRLGDCLLKVDNIKWKQTDKEYLYIDLSSVDRDNHIIVDTKQINTKTAPSRAQQIIKTGDILFGGTRPMLKRSCIVNEEYNNQICSTGFCVLRANPEKVLPKWIYFMISTDEFYNYVEKNQKGASYPAISDGDVKNYMISLPTLEKQKEIVDLLDKLEKICNNIFNKLPVEIENRKTQYNYYRDLLMNFEEVILNV